MSLLKPVVIVIDEKSYIGVLFTAWYGTVHTRRVTNVTFLVTNVTFRETNQKQAPCTRDHYVRP